MFSRTILNKSARRASAILIVLKKLQLPFCSKLQQNNHVNICYNYMAELLCDEKKNSDYFLNEKNIFTFMNGEQSQLNALHMATIVRAL